MESSKCRLPERSRPLVIAHRGASGVAPENTCLALTTAMDFGADMVEVDVQVSRDGCAVLFHDANLGRLARAAAYTRRALRSLRIHDLSVADLKQLDVGSWMNEKFAGLSIPTLDEFLSWWDGFAIVLEPPLERTSASATLSSRTEVSSKTR